MIYRSIKKFLGVCVQKFFLAYVIYKESPQCAFYRYSVKYLDLGGPSGIRTRVAALKGLCPRPLDDGTLLVNRAGLEPATPGLKVRCSTD